MDALKPTPATVEKPFGRYVKAIEEASQKPKTIIYSTTIFSFLAISLFGWYAIRPTLQTILYLKREIKDKTDINKKMDQKITSLIEAQAAYQKIQKDIPVLYQAIPRTTNVVDLVSALKNIASQSGVQIASVQIPEVPLYTAEASLPGTIVQKNTNKEKKLLEFNLSLSVNGQYPQVKTFLEKSREYRRLMTIDTLAMTPQKEGLSASSSSSLIRLVLKLKSYYLSQ
ncbi:hypothetical protein HY947_05265 [Candidatus Gottesmanbacteria bacterium]|nr:hypothetical protein [Candidatus Gottesmanbacteria bacterium]